MKAGTRSEVECRIEDGLGYRFRDLELLRQALTHTSALHEGRAGAANERLEFLGDAVLGLVVTEWLYKLYPERAEGELTKLRGRLVSRPALARCGFSLHLGEGLVLGRGEERSRGRMKPSLLSNALEALLGALYLECGLEGTTPVVHRLLEPLLRVEEEPSPPMVESKNRLQEYLQARSLGVPLYAVTRESGPDHDKSFEVEARVGDEVLGKGRGRTKKVAEQRAAKRAIDRLEG